MMAGVFGTAASHNDLGVLNLSRLQEYLEEILFPEHLMPSGVLPALYCECCHVFCLLEFLLESLACNRSKSNNEINKQKIKYYSSD